VSPATTVVISSKSSMIATSADRPIITSQVPIETERRR
jgi:hypothetical protein